MEFHHPGSMIAIYEQKSKCCGGRITHEIKQHTGCTRRDFVRVTLASGLAVGTMGFEFLGSANQPESNGMIYRTLGKRAKRFQRSVFGRITHRQSLNGRATASKLSAVLSTVG
jgi:hypothetical protein